MAEENNTILTLDIRLLNKEQLPNNLIKIAEEHLKGKKNITTRGYLVEYNDKIVSSDTRIATIDISQYAIQLSKLKEILKKKKDSRIDGIPLSILIEYDGQKHHIKIRNSKLYLQ